MKPTITSDEEKALFFAMYLGQKVVLIDDDYKPINTNEWYVNHKIQICFNDYITDDNDVFYLLLRGIDSLSDEEKEIIAKRMQWYPEDVIDWINGDCGHDDYENLYTWLPCYDILRAFGILLSFTYLSANNTPITLSPAELINRGWAKIKTK